MTYQLVNGVSVPILNFENSDDRGKGLIPGVGKSHLFYCKMKFNLKSFQAVVDEYFPGNDPVVEIQLPILRDSASPSMKTLPPLLISRHSTLNNSH